jgi:hypothetical protein
MTSPKQCAVQQRENHTGITRVNWREVLIQYAYRSRDVQYKYSSVQ